jgi:hypothetical protein
LNNLIGKKIDQNTKNFACNENNVNLLTILKRQSYLLSFHGSTTENSNIMPRNSRNTEDFNQICNIFQTLFSFFFVLTLHPSDSVI